ncbi:dTDP-4-dehydrorhamnose reductase [Candidatus Methylocalor cossyra]|uniref:dTDP-4-dehydrorhamnose reductase n=1 Tax=Candidatus Methylocalor cossyra TaxID=3108543 RepID=A0ABM9NKW8_9GAMM
MKILLIGTEGQVAYELRRSLACLGEVLAYDRRTQPALDLADFAGLRRTILGLRPTFVVNAAAYTAVDRAEQETQQAHCLNGEAPGVLAEAAAAVGAVLIHYSTDYVFAGEASAPYREEDPVGPTSAYGRSKLAGEEAIRQVGGAHFILRTAWVYGRRGHNFLRTMLRLLKEREVLRVVDDQRGAPTWSRLVAEATALLIARCTREGRFEADGKTGTYHLTCAGETTWYDFAVRIRTLAQAQGLLPADCARLEPIPTSAYPTPARRPAYSVLSNAKLGRNFDLRLPDWQQALELCMGEFSA